MPVHACAERAQARAEDTRSLRSLVVAPCRLHAPVSGAAPAIIGRTPLHFRNQAAVRSKRLQAG